MKYLVLALVAILGAQPSLAAETVKYTYDALGRLVKVEHVGGSNDGMQQTTAFDPAGNRSNHTVTGVKSRVIVLPLNGFTIIPLGPQ